MNRFVSTMASFAMVQSAADSSAMATETTMMATTEMSINIGNEIEGNFTGTSTVTDAGLMESSNWMLEFEKFYHDENNFDYQEFLNNLKPDEKTDFNKFVSSNVILE